MIKKRVESIMEVRVMTVLVIESCSKSLRGELTKWLLEVKPGTYVGKINSMVRDKIWEKYIVSKSRLNALMVYDSNNEQGFKILMHGEPTRSVIDLDGIQMIQVN